MPASGLIYFGPLLAYEVLLIVGYTVFAHRVFWGKSTALKY